MTVESLARWIGGASQEGGGVSSAELVVRALTVAALAVIPLLIFLPRKVRRRRFWCALERREVEVQFEEAGPPGLGQPVAVESCSAFDPPTAVACARRCLDVAFRRQWEPAQALRGHGAADDLARR